VALNRLSQTIGSASVALFAAFNGTNDASANSFSRNSSRSLAERLLLPSDSFSCRASTPVDVATCTATPSPSAVSLTAALVFKPCSASPFALAVTVPPPPPQSSALAPAPAAAPGKDTGDASGDITDSGPDSDIEIDSDTDDDDEGTVARVYLCASTGSCEVASLPLATNETAVNATEAETRAKLAGVDDTTTDPLDWTPMESDEQAPFNVSSVIIVLRDVESRGALAELGYWVASPLSAGHMVSTVGTDPSARGSDQSELILWRALRDPTGQFAGALRVSASVPDWSAIAGAFSHLPRPLPFPLISNILAVAQVSVVFPGERVGGRGKGHPLPVCTVVMEGERGWHQGSIAQLLGLPKSCAAQSCHAVPPCLPFASLSLSL